MAAGLDQRQLVALVDVCRLVEVVGQAHATGLLAVHQVQQQVHVGQRLDGHGGAVGSRAVDVGVDHRLPADLGDLEGQLEQILEPQLVVVGRHQARQVLARLVVADILLGRLRQVEHRQGLAGLVLAGTVDDLVDMPKRFLMRREDDAEALQVGDLALVDLAVEQRQLVLEVVVVAADIAQGAGDIGNCGAACLGQGQRLVLAMGVGVD
ncbi:hypothetical protein D3C85_695710 [compost metagenome]